MDLVSFETEQEYNWVKGFVDGNNDVNNGDPDDLVQRVEILCGLTVKVEPPDASEQLLKVKVEEETQPFFASLQDNDIKLRPG